MKKYNLTIDIGNTHIVFGLFYSSELIESKRIATDRLKTEDEYYVIIKNLFGDIISLEKISNVILSSVVPPLTRVFDHLTKKYIKKNCIIVSSKTDLGLIFPMENPENIGADLLVNAFAAKEIYKTNVIVCDLGTATTIQLVGKNGYFYGTSIIPGIVTSANSLFNKASLLSNIRLETPNTILGTNTKDALLSGIIKGHAFIIDGFVREIKKEYSSIGEITVVATGGMAEMLSEISEEIDSVNKNLTLIGLNLIANS